MRSRVRATTSGALAELSIGGLSLLQYPASELEAGPANLWLRLRGPDAVLVAAALTGPASGSSVVQGPNGPGVSGAVGGVTYRAWFDIADDGGRQLSPAERSDDGLPPAAVTDRHRQVAALTGWPGAEDAR